MTCYVLSLYILCDKVLYVFLDNLFSCSLNSYLLSLLQPDQARRAGSDGSMSASGSAGPGFDPRRGSKFSFEMEMGGDVHFLIARLYITGLD